MKQRSRQRASERRSRGQLILARTKSQMQSPPPPGDWQPPQPVAASRAGAWHRPLIARSNHREAGAGRRRDVSDTKQTAPPSVSGPHNKPAQGNDCFVDNYCQPAAATLIVVSHEQRCLCPDIRCAFRKSHAQCLKCWMLLNRPVVQNETACRVFMYRLEYLIQRQFPALRLVFGTNKWEFLHSMMMVCV